MKFWGTARVVKRHKRLWIEVLETGEVLYSPPDFVRAKMKSREKIEILADQFTLKQKRDIEDIAKFEAGIVHA